MPATATTTPSYSSHAVSVENILIGQMENINPAPTTFRESQDLSEFLDFAQQYVSIVEPSDMFARRVVAFLETIQRAQVQQQEQPRPRVHVTRVGARRVFADITHEVMQEENIAANFRHT
jgi:hypothetical protein